MITWNQRSGPVKWESADHLYRVVEAYTAGRIQFRALFRAHALSATPIGELRDDAMTARADAEAHALTLRAA